jgi:hypothetical protein
VFFPREVQARELKLEFSGSSLPPLDRKAKETLASRIAQIHGQQNAGRARVRLYTAKSISSLVM